MSTRATTGGGVAGEKPGTTTTKPSNSRRRSRRVAEMQSVDQDAEAKGKSAKEEKKSTKKTKTTTAAKKKASQKDENPEDNTSNKRSKKSGKREEDEEQKEEKDGTKPWYTFFTNSDPTYDEYMRTEWGFERNRGNDNALFEKLSLEGAQAGLSWRTILFKREAYRRAFHQFDIYQVAQMNTVSDVDALLKKQSTNTQELVVRHRGKLESVITNARCLVGLLSKKKISSLDEYLWSFVNDKPIFNVQWKRIQEAPTTNEESEAMSRALKQHGLKFVGPTICYSLMQSVGMIVDHPVDSPEWHEARRRLEERAGGYQER